MFSGVQEVLKYKDGDKTYIKLPKIIKEIRCHDRYENAAHGAAECDIEVILCQMSRGRRPETVELSMSGHAADE